MYNIKYHNISFSNKTFLITGGAGFIGSNLAEYLIIFGAKKVRVLDNLSTGKYENIRDFVSESCFEFIEGDIRNLETCRDAVDGIDFVLHQAALGSVPRSIEDPVTSNDVNVTGFLNMMIAARDAHVERFVYASSSSAYGDIEELPKVEGRIGRPLSPYAITKYVNELYADVFFKVYGLNSIGLRYFNVFGQKQNPNGAYAAVIPKFVSQLKNHESPVLNGDGSFTRDFTYIENIVQMNILALTTNNVKAVNRIYNAATGERIKLFELVELIKKHLSVYDKKILDIQANIGPYRLGDIPHSQASISQAKTLLNYSPIYKINEGMKEAVKWYWNNPD